MGPGHHQSLPLHTHVCPLTSTCRAAVLSSLWGLGGMEQGLTNELCIEVGQAFEVLACDSLGLFPSARQPAGFQNAAAP